MSRADIIAAIKNRGVTLRALAEKHGLSPAAISVALSRPWPRVEKIIGEAIGVEPQKIWPPRYPSKGLPIKRGDAAAARGTIRGTVHSRTRTGGKRARA